MPMLRGFRSYPYFCGVGVVSGIEASKERRSLHVNKAFSAKITIIIGGFRVTVNTYVPIFRGLDARGGRKLRTDTRDNLII